MAKKLFKSMFAFAMVAALAVGFVACETDEPEVSNPTVELSTKSLTFSNAEGTKSVEVTANAGWVVDAGDADWITVTPQTGNGNGVISVSVPMNDTGVLRQATIKVSSVHPEWGPGWDTKRITVSQSADEKPAVETKDLYYDNFDGEEATKTYGSEGTSYPFIDEFPQFANATGDAAANVTYSGSGASVRASTPSNGTYSDYAGSGLNNIFFGRSAFFQINGIALESNQNNLTLSFGGVKYAQDGDSKFSTDEFKVYVSKNGQAWVELEYTFAGTTDGKWNVATADFTLTEVPSALYVKFTASVASVYRIDDARLATGNGGQQITLPTEAVLPDMEEVTVAEFLEAAEDATLYKLTGEITRVANEVYGNFDITDATGTVYVYGLLTPDGVDKTQWAAAGLKKGDTITIYGPRSSYNGSPQMTNATYISHVPGEGGGEEPTPGPAEGPYASDAPFVCSADDSTNAAYTLNGTTIDGSAVTGVKLGKGKQTGRFTSAAIGVSGDKYLNFYAAAWNGSSNISLYYRIDGGAIQSQPLAANTTVAGTIPFASLKFADSDHYSVKLTGLTENSTIEFSSDPNFELTAYDSNAPRLVVCGVKLADEPIVVEPTPEPDPEPDPEPSEPIEATVAEFLAAAEDDTQLYILKGTITNVANTTYGNFDLTDDTGTVYIYGLCSPEGAQQYWEESGAQLGDDIVIKTIRTSFGGSPQGKNALFVELTSPGTRAFWSFSKTATTFSSAGGEQVITVSAYNLTDSITATSDNAQFSASYADGQLTIVAAQNTTSDAISGNITVTAGALQQVITVTQGGVSASGEEVTAEATMLSMGWANAAVIKDPFKLDDNVSVTVAQNTASTAPTYYANGESLRLYQNGATMTITANGKTIKSIEFTFDGSYTHLETTTPTYANGTWTGEATEVVFSTPKSTEKTYRAYIKSIKVTYID